MKTLLTLITLICSVSLTTAQDEKAVPYKELQSQLPGTIAGFKITGDPDGQSMTMNGMSYSMASKDYEKGDEEMTITIMDYKGASTLYSAAAMAWTMNMEYEDDEKKVSSFKDGDFQGIIEVGKEHKEISIIAGYKERYLVQVQIQGSNEEPTARKIVNALDLSDLP
ncbi:MAG: hypothetical protein AAF843_09795 [Bacteroidota bacterium]